MGSVVEAALRRDSAKSSSEQPKSNNVGEIRKSPTKLVDGR
jgi:hypothetical protein